MNEYLFRSNVKDMAKTILNNSLDMKNGLSSKHIQVICISDLPFYAILL